MDYLGAIARAVAEVWEDLPGLVGAEWPEFEAQILTCLRLLETPGEDHSAVNDRLLELFAGQPAARARLLEAFARMAPAETRHAASSRDQSAEAKARHVVVRVYYGTDRAATGKSAANDFYGGDRGELSFGVAEVAIPDDHRKGRLEKPRWWKLQFSENPDKHVMLLGLEGLGRDRFAERARAELAEADESHALIFVHGYKVTFKDAVRRAAQIAADLNFEGLPMLYSWPSEGEVAKYTVDEANVRWSRPHFREFLELALTGLGVARVSIVAHSMGNRAVAETLATFDPDELPEGCARLRHIAFAAPDIDKDTFAELARAFEGRADRFTLYASSKDVALKLSKKVHKYPRAGDAEPEMLVVDTIDSIDATVVDTSLVGHSYYGDNRSVISDLFHLLRNNLAPADRGLVARAHAQGTYWVMK